MLLSYTVHADIHVCRAEFSLLIALDIRSRFAMVCDLLVAAHQELDKKQASDDSVEIVDQNPGVRAGAVRSRQLVDVLSLQSRYNKVLLKKVSIKSATRQRDNTDKHRNYQKCRKVLKPM